MYLGGNRRYVSLLSILDSFRAGTKPYGLGFCSHIRTVIFSAISVTERGCVAQISRVECHTLDRCSYYACVQS